MKFFTPIIFLILLIAPFAAYSQFRIDTLAQAPDIGFPVCVTFPPDGSGRIFFTEKNNGRVRIIRNDSLLPTPFLTISVTSGGEQGLLGMTFHPQYPDSPYVYIYYTRSGDRANMLVRYTDQNDVGVDPVLFMQIPRLTAATNHNGGNIHFGPDGKLYVSIGEYAVTSNSQDTSNSNKRGKIHRLNADGSIPADNPFPGNSIFVYGCRNSFDFTFDAQTGIGYSTENGPGCNDEINLLSSGGNYGWPSDGNCTYSGNPMYKRPLYYWSSNLPAVTGITVYRGSAFPELDGVMLVASYNHERIYRFNLNAGGDSIISAPTTFLDYGSALDDVEVGPDGFIYITNGSYSGDSRVLRLRPLVSAPASPALATPAEGAINQPRRPTLVWHPSVDATSYYLQVSTDSLFTSLIISDSSITDTAKLAPPLSYDTKHYWRVRAKNSAGISPFSPVWDFTTIIATPEIPALVYPANETTNQPLVLTLRWLTSARASSYRLQVSTDSSFSSTQYDFPSLADTAAQIDSLTNNVSYFWRVSASNIGGTSVYSPVWKFTTVADYSTIVISLSPNWNLLSLPLYPFNRAAQYLFPEASSSAYEYSPGGGYVARDTLTNGLGFWVKFSGSSDTSVSFMGYPALQDTFDVAQGWNLIGSISDSILADTIQSLPPGIIVSQFFGYDNGYTSTPHVIAPGKGYWVKVSANGKIILNSTAFKK